jgi:hypothetical protein
LRSRWLTAGGLAAALFLALAHQFLACGAALALMLLTGLVGRRELLGRPARWFAAAIGASAVFWIAFGLLTDTWYGAAPAGGPAAVDRLVALTWELGGFPNILDEVVRPWGRTIPVLSVALFIALAALALRSVVREPVRVTAIGALLVLVLIMVLAIGGAGSPRIETRYSFFLYPLMVTLALAAVAFACDRFFERGPRATLATALAGLLLFAATEDFQPRHIANIDSREVNFRIGLSPEFTAHYYPRGDVGGLAQWLAVEVGPEDLVISGVPHLHQYYRDIDYFFLDDQDIRYGQYACNNGSAERWSNLPLLYSADALAPHVESGRRIFIALYSNSQERLLGVAAERGWRAEVTRLPEAGGGSVLVLNP